MMRTAHVGKSALVPVKINKHAPFLSQRGHARLLYPILHGPGLEQRQAAEKEGDHAWRNASRGSVVAYKLIWETGTAGRVGRTLVRRIAPVRDRFCQAFNELQWVEELQRLDQERATHRPYD